MRATNKKEYIMNIIIASRATFLSDEEKAKLRHFEYIKPGLFGDSNVGVDYYGIELDHELHEGTEEEWIDKVARLTHEMNNLYSGFFMNFLSELSENFVEIESA